MVILSSPSGAGKTTLVKLLSQNKDFHISVSHTTRKPRTNEIADKDYYFILGLAKEDLPTGKSRKDVIKTSEVLEKAFRVKARKCHPDFGGSNEAFLDIVRSRRILEDPLLLSPTFHVPFGRVRVCGVCDPL